MSRARRSTFRSCYLPPWDPKVHSGEVATGQSRLIHPLRNPPTDRGGWGLRHGGGNTFLAPPWRAGLGLRPSQRDAGGDRVDNLQLLALARPCDSPVKLGVE